MKRIVRAAVIILLLAGWLGFWFWPADDAMRAKPLDSEIRALELERSQVEANALKRQKEHVAATQALAGADDASRVLAEAERIAQEVKTEHLKAIDALVSRKREDLAHLRP